MMDWQELERIPRRPVSEVEWEDLLLRLEVMPRALRYVLDDRDGAEVGDALRELADREGWVQSYLARALPWGGAAPEVAFGMAQVVVRSEDALDRFMRLRGRSFAILQRRGIDVWEFEAEVMPGRSATVHQVLVGLTALDVDALAVLRAVGREG